MTTLTSDLLSGGMRNSKANTSIQSKATGALEMLPVKRKIIQRPITPLMTKNNRYRHDFEGECDETRETRKVFDVLVLKCLLLGFYTLDFPFSLLAKEL